MMTTPEIVRLQPETWEKARGFSYGIIATGGRMLFLSGQVGDQKGSLRVSQDGGIAAQWEQALANVVELTKAAGGGPEHITSLRIYLTDIAAYEAAGAEVGAAWKKHMGRNYPASTMVQVSALYAPGVMVEIEAFAVIP